ncbi:RfaL Lipid A core - O-antigen ligase and related enzymes [Burkholderiaceae bacterium]
MDTLNFSHRIFPWVTGLLMASILVVPGVYVLLTVWLALYGLWHVRGFTARVWQPSLTLGASPIWAGMAVYVAVGMGLGWLHGYKASYFEAYVPMLLAPLIVNALLVARPPESMLYWGAASGAIVAGFVASYESLLIERGRAIGGLNNEIMFGDLSVVFGLFSLFGWLYYSKKPFIKLVFIFGFLMAVLASFLSGSKGGWLSILTIVIAVAWVQSFNIHWVRRVAFVVIILIAISFIAFSVPSYLVVDRLVNGFIAGVNWINGMPSSGNSVDIRFEMWNQSIQMLIEKPILGWTKDVATFELNKRLLDEGVMKAPGIGYWTQAENDFLQIGIVHGVLGQISYFFLYFGLILGFLKIRNNHSFHHLSNILAILGIILVILFLQFGISVVVLGRNAFRHTLIVWAMMILSYMIIAWDAQRPFVPKK